MPSILIAIVMQLSDDIVNKMTRNLQKYDLIYLQGSYVRELIDSAIEKAGSMRHLGRIMGYFGPSPNWSIKRIRAGKQGIPYFKILKLADFLNLHPNDILKHTAKIRIRRRLVSPTEFYA